MSRTHFKRYRMELPLDRPFDVPTLPAGFSFVSWKEHLTDTHGDVKFRCFVGDLDSQVFPNLGSLIGCRQLMRSIRSHPGFCPKATWLISGPDGYAGTVQGVIDPGRYGGLQNLGVVPEYRGVGLGTALLLQCLEGFRVAGARTAYLEVTADNIHAIRLYRRFGFRNTRANYRPIASLAAMMTGSGI